MSKGNTDPESIHVQTAACYADADHGLKPSNVFFYSPCCPRILWEPLAGADFLLEYYRRQAGAVVSRHAQRVLPWCCGSRSCCHWCWHASPPWPAGLGAPGLLQAWCLWLGTAALWGTTGMQKLFSPFPLFLTLVEKEPSGSAWESTSPHRALTGCGEHTLIHEVDAYGFISAGFG